MTFAAALPSRFSARPATVVRIALVALAFVLAFGFAAERPAEAMGTLDQQQTHENGSACSPSGVILCSQTFTAGLSGALDQVDIVADNRGASGDLTIQIRTVLGGVPNGTILATEDIPSASVPAPKGWLSVPLSPPAAVTAGAQYAIVVLAPTTGLGDYLVNLQPATNPYSGGSYFFSLNNGALWNIVAGADLAFKTYVFAPAVDADADGVCNRDVRHPACTGSDLCPGTAPGAQVDSRGCAWVQVDANKDGICDRDKTSDRWCRRR